MSDYNKLLQQLNNKNTSLENENPATASDNKNESVIDWKDNSAEAAKTEEALRQKQAMEEKAKTESRKRFDEIISNSSAKVLKNGGRDFLSPFSEELKSESNERGNNGRFIKSGEAEFISVKGEAASEIPASAKKYTDRFIPKGPDAQQHTGYTGKINTYTATHSPSANSPKFIVPQETKKADKITEVNAKVNIDEGATKVIPKITDNASPLSEEEALRLQAEKAEAEKTKQFAGKGDLLRELAKTSKGAPTEEDEAQLTMEGFSEEDSAPETLSEKDELLLQKELSEVREKRIKNFRFWTKSAVETGESEDKSFSAPKEEKKLPDFLNKFAEKFASLDTDFVSVQGDEYTDPSRRKEIFSRLIEVRKSVIIKTMIVGLLGVILILINISATLSAAMHNGFFEILGGSPTVYSAVNLFFLIVTGIVMFDDLKKGVFQLLKIRPKTDSVLFFIYVSALLQTVVSFFTQMKAESDFHLISGAAILLCIPVLISKIFYYDSIRHCFKAVAATSDKCYLRKISDEALIASLLKDSTNTETNVVYAGKTRFITNFLKRSSSSAYAGQTSSRIALVAMALSVVAALIGLITSKSIVFALGAMASTAALSFPVSCLVFTGFMLSSENSTLSVKSSFVGSYSDAHSFCCIDDIILEGKDIFSAEVISVSCSENVSEKQAQFCAAVLTNKAGGILSKAFSAYAAGLQDKFPEVEDLTSEDKLGISAWISDCKVLLGTKDFLINHNVTLPENNTVPFVLEENSKPLFLAIEGHFAAVFSVKYSCDSLSAKSLQELTSNGANILISCDDPNINEEFGEQVLRLPRNSLRIIKYTANEKFNTTRNTVTDSEETGIIFSDSFDAFSKTMASAIKLDKTKKAAKSICEAVSVAGGAFGIVLSLAKATAGINSWLPVVLQIFCIIILFGVVPMLTATTVKSRIQLPSSLPASLPSKLKKSTFITREDSSYEEIDENNSITEDFEEEEKNTVTAAENNEPDFEFTYPEPPVTEDFSNFSLKEEADTEDNYGESKISSSILDSFAAHTSGIKRSVKAVSEKSSKLNISEKLGFFKKIPSFITVSDDEEEEEKTEKRSILSFADEKIPEPPKYDLSKKKEEEKEDPLNASFIPPENHEPSAIYNDDFFSSYDTKKDDEAFRDVRRQRETKTDEGEFDFWRS